MRKNFYQGKSFISSSGRPPKLGDKQKKDVIQQVIIAKDNKNALDTKELKKFNYFKKQRIFIAARAK